MYDDTNLDLTKKKKIAQIQILGYPDSQLLHS